MEDHMHALAPYRRDAKKFAMNAHTQLVGDRFRYEPTPNKLTQYLEVGHLIGELSCAERFLAILERDPTMTIQEFMGEVHLYIMSVNNVVHDEFGLGSRIEGVEHFTDQYFTEQSLQFAQ
jgi:hypothetical protein